MRYIKVLLFIVLLGVIFFAGPIIYYFPLHNMRILASGKFVGARQMNSRSLESTIRNYGIQTVINLRGENPGSSWYDDEVKTSERLGITLVNLGWSQNSLPSPESLAKFTSIIKSGQGPFLCHCAGGTHRTGLAAAIYLLLNGSDVTTAKRQFRIGFKNAPIGTVVDLFSKSRLPFDQWVIEEYPSHYALLK